METETEITSSRFPRIWIALATVAVIALVAAFYLDHAAAALDRRAFLTGLKKSNANGKQVGALAAHLIAGQLGVCHRLCYKSKRDCEFFSQCWSRWRSLASPAAS